MQNAAAQANMETRVHIPAKLSKAMARLQQSRSPSITMFNHVIHLCGQSGNLGHAALCFDELLRRGLTPNICTMGTILNACAEKPDIKLLDFYTDIMHRFGIEHNEVTCNTLIKAFSNVGDVKRGEAVMDLMQAKSIHVSITTCNSLLQTYLKAGELDQAAQFVTSMENSDIGTSAVTYNSMISAMAVRGAVASAQRWFTHMTSRNLTPSLVSYGALCKAFGRRGQVDEVRNIMGSLEDAGMELNEYFYASLIFACGVCEPRDTKNAEKAVEDMACRGMNAWKVKAVLGRVLGSVRTSQVLEPYVRNTDVSGSVSASRRQRHANIQNGKQHRRQASRLGRSAKIQSGSIEEPYDFESPRQVSSWDETETMDQEVGIRHPEIDSNRSAFLYNLISCADPVHPIFGDLTKNELIFGESISL